MRKAIVLVKLLIYDNFYLVENSYTKFALGPMKRFLISGDVSEYMTQNGVSITKLQTDFKVWP